MHKGNTEIQRMWKKKECENVTETETQRDR